MIQQSNDAVEPAGNVFATSSPNVAALIAAKDWSKTPLGDPACWSPALRTILNVSLANRFPVVFWWGPEYTQFYNDPYSVILGTKHPESLGQSGRECWAEIWHVIGPQIDSVFRGGPGTWNEDLLLYMNRHGFVEETYFTFSYSALPDPQAPSGIGGVLGTVQETTEKVVGERRMRLLRDLAARSTEAKTVEEECDLAVQTMQRYAQTVPFSLIYMIDEQKRTATLVAASDVTKGSPAAPLTIELDGDARWPLARALADGNVQFVEDVTASFPGFEEHGFANDVLHAVVAPIQSNAPNEIAGFLVAGVNPRRPFDDRYRDFYGLIAAQIGTAISSARAYEAERRRAEALAEIDRAKNVFFSNVSHEFRTPLTLMLGPLSELLKRAGAEERPLLESAQRNSLRLLKLVNTLLEFSRIEAGRVDAAYTETDLAALTQALCGVFRPAVEAAGLDFTVNIDLREPVYVDRSMWEKIVLNLLSNALKFTLAGSVSLTLARQGSFAVLEVEDTGTGIPQEELPHLFERFRRVRGAKSRSFEGSGIGLALVNDLVELHGGAIDVTSEIDVGTSFRVRIPLGSAHLDPASVVSADAPAAHASGIVEQFLADVDSTIVRSDAEAPVIPASHGTERPHILVADDNGDLREYLVRLLAPAYNVVAVRNGVEALAAARQQRFDLIVSDVMMPEMDGFALLKAIRAESALSTTPFIMLSARAGEEAALEGVTHGADDYIAKPFSADDLLARVQAHLNAASIREEAWQISEERFRAFADRIPIMIWQHDATGALTFTNAAWHTITHLPREKTSYDPQTWARVIHPDDYSRVIAQIEEAISNGMTYRFEYRVKPADAGDDAYRWYIATAEPQYVNGVLQGWIGNTVDIHDSRAREDVERRLRHEATAREREFHALAEAIPVIAFSADATGWIDWYNNRWYEYTGQTPEEAAGWGWQAVHHPEDFPRVMERWPHSIETGEMFEMEFRLRRHDGVYHTFLSRIRPMRNERGEVIRWYGSNVDIQAQKEALEHSKRVAETLQAVFLPETLPHTEKVRFDAVYVAAERDALIGGDWFDAARLPDGRYLISIGDVTGHGLDASVIAGTLRQAILSFALTVQDPAEILQLANRMLRFQSPDKYATAVIGLIDSDCTTLRYACAGHPAPLLASSGDSEVQTLPYGGYPLGVEPAVEAVSHTVEIARDAVLALYTDGLIEFARDTDAAEAALKRAVADVASGKAAGRPAVAVRDAVLGNVRPVDDVAILVAQFSPRGVQEGTNDTTALRKVWRFHSSDPYTARTSRHELMTFFRRFAADHDSLFTVELVLGEILANTVEHAPGLVEIDVDWTAEKPVIVVRDTGPGFSGRLPHLPSDILDQDGRGLFLMNALSDKVTVKPAPGFGTELTVVLPVVRSKPERTET